MYEVEVTRTAEKELTALYRCDRKLYSRVINAIESLAGDPEQGKALKHALKGLYSLRVGAYRIIYTIIRHRLVVSIVDIGHRRDIYRQD